jgi:hypothetical protein
MRQIKKIYEGELRCWICKRNAREVEEMIQRSLAPAIKWRGRLDLDNKGEDGAVIQLVDTEFTGLPLIPLCIVCQGILLYQGAEAACGVIDNKLIEGELMPYTEYEIVEKEKDEG